jgi:hypothetical protein
MLARVEREHSGATALFHARLTPLAANQGADRVAQPGAIIPPVLKLPQATWRQSSRRWLRRRSAVYSKSS